MTPPSSNRGGHNGANGRARAWTPDDALDAGRRWVEEYGTPPSRRELNPALIRRAVRRARVKLQRLEEMEQRFNPAEMPGVEVVTRLFGGMDSYLHALGFTPRGVGRPPRELDRLHVAEARDLTELLPGHQDALTTLERLTCAAEGEMRYQRRKHGHDLGPVEPDLDDLEAAGLIVREVRVSYRLTPAGKARLSSEVARAHEPPDGSADVPADEPGGRRARPRPGRKPTFEHIA